MKLELKHLAPYLPYGLKIKSKKHFYKYGEETILQLNGLAFQDIAEIPYWQYEFIYDNDLKFSNINEKGFKPILRPLSDLTKEIEVNGEKFVPCDILFKCDAMDIIMGFSSKEDAINFINDQYRNDLCYPLAFWEKLFEWHFDVFGLIEKCLAVDINTLKQ